MITKSYGNVIVWNNCLDSGPRDNDLFALYGLADITIIGQDAETYPNNTTLAQFHTGKRGKKFFQHFDNFLDENMETFRIFGNQGRMEVTGPIVEPQPGNFDIGAEEFISVGNVLSQVGITDPDIVFRPTNNKSLILNCGVVPLSIKDEKSSPFRISSFYQPNVTLNGIPIVSSPLSTSQQETFRQLISSNRRTVATYPKPVFEPIPDPAGPNWASGLSSKPDSTAYIQNLINTQGIAFLPAGTYYISSSLHLGKQNGIIGAGDSQTVIIAKSPDIDMIVGNLANEYFQLDVFFRTYSSRRFKWDTS